MSAEVLNIPGYRDAVEREAAEREFAFLRPPETVCGVDLVPMTFRLYILLCAVDSPFLRAGAPDAQPVDAALFLWAASLQRTAALRRAARLTRCWRRSATLYLALAQMRFARKLRRLPFDEVKTALAHYVDRAFVDAPPLATVHRTSYYGWPADYVDLLASEYGWSQDAILDMPIGELFQTVRKITLRRNPETVFFNPSDRIIGRYLAEVNKR